MVQPCPAKCAKLGAYHQTSYHDTIPMFNDYSTVQSSEGVFRNIRGSSCATAIQVEHSSAVDVGDWNQLSLWSPPDDDQYALNPDGEQFNTVLEADVMKEEPPPVRKQRKKQSMVSVSYQCHHSAIHTLFFLKQRPHIVWKELHHQEYLEEIICWAGQGDFQEASACPDCLSHCITSPGCPEYWCQECVIPDLMCSTCCIKRHRTNPLHHIQVFTLLFWSFQLSYPESHFFAQKWTGEHFVEGSLKSMGLIVQLNHSANYCENPINCHAEMLVLHTNSIHSVSICYCSCACQIPHHLQLLRRCLYPASQCTPRMCTTFELLQHLHKMALTTKASTYDFYQCLEKSMNNTGIKPPKS